MSRITQHLSFCVWLLSLGLISSKSIHSGACVSRPSPLKAEQHSTQGIHSVLLIHPALSKYSGGLHCFTVNDAAMNVVRESLLKDSAFNPFRCFTQKRSC